MTIIRVGLTTGKSKTIEIDKPSDEIQVNDIYAKGVSGITGWVDVEEEVRQSRKQLIAQSDRIDELKAIIKELNDEIDGNHRKNRRLADDTEFAKRQMSTCKKQFDRLEKAYNDSVEQGRRQHDTIGNQRNMLADCEKTVQRLVDSNKDDRTIVDDMNKTIRDQKATINELKVSGDQRTIHLQKMRIDEQKETILRLVKEVKELRDTDDFIRKIRDRDNIIERLERNLHDTNTALDESRKIAREYHKKYDSLKRILAAVKESNADTIGKLETANEAGYSVYQNLYQQNHNLILKAEIRDGRIKELKADLTEKTVRNNDLIKQYLLDQKEIEKLDCEIKELQKERDEYKESIKLERIDRAAEKRTVSRCYSNDLRKKNAIILEIAKDRDEWRQSTSDACAIIRGLKDHCIKYSIDEIKDAEDAIEASADEVGL